MPYKFLEHTADLKIEASGANLESAFSEAAMALREAIIGVGSKIEVKPEMKKRIRVSGKDKEALLYRFLEEFLYLLDARDFLLCRIEDIRIEGEELFATVSGDKASNYKFTNDVKAVTYNEMKIKEEEDRVKIIYVVDV